MQTLKTLLDNPALNVFLGTLPLLLTLAWGLLTNNKALDNIGKRIDSLESSVGKRLDRIDTRLDGLEKDVHSIDVRLTKVETRLENTRLVMGD